MTYNVFGGTLNPTLLLLPVVEGDINSLKLSNQDELVHNKLRRLIRGIGIEKDRDNSEG